jgi:hypothetical protein
VNPRGFVIRFAEYIPADQLDSFVSQLAALGTLDFAGERECTLVVERVGKLRWLEQLLMTWENHGFATNRPL